MSVSLNPAVSLPLASRPVTAGRKNSFSSKPQVASHQSYTAFCPPKPLFYYPQLSLRFGQNLTRLDKATLTSEDILKQQISDPRFNIPETVNPGDSPDMPSGFKGRLAGQKILVLGTGNIYTYTPKFDVQRRLNWLQGDEGTQLNRYWFDPGQQSPKSIVGTRIEVDNLSTTKLPLLEDPFLTMVLTPNSMHVPHVLQLLNNPKVKGIYCEKPMATTPEELEQLEEGLKISQKPIYFNDHMYFFAAGAAMLLGKKMPYKNFLVVDEDPNQIIQKALENNQSVLGPIQHVELRTLETTDPSRDGRDYLMKRATGGVMTDNMVHLTSFAHFLGLSFKDLNTVDLRAFKTGSEVEAEDYLSPELPAEKVQGVLTKRYIPIQEADSEAAENYVHIEGTLRNAGKTLELAAGATFEINNAKCWPAQHDDRALIFRDSKGRTLTIYPNTVYDRKTQQCSRIEIKDGDQIVAKAHFKVYPYLLNLHHGLTFLTSDLAQQPESSVMFFEEQKQSLQDIARMKKAGGITA